VSNDLVYFLTWNRTLCQGAKLGLDVFIHRLLPIYFRTLVVSQWLLYVLYKQNAWQPSFINNLKIYGIGAFGGFPTGAATISTLVKAKMLSSKTASHLIGICHAPSPMFVMGVVGTQFLSSPKKGLLILVLIHLINALFLLFLFAFSQINLGKSEFKTGSISI
jgi:hypothetical protein